MFFTRLLHSTKKVHPLSHISSYLQSKRARDKWFNLGLHPKVQSKAIREYINHLSKTQSHEQWQEFPSMIRPGGNMENKMKMVKSSMATFDKHLFPHFINYALTLPLSQNTEHIQRWLQSLHTIADLRSPTTWFPDARQIKRKIILHVGPTNSGKTHHALNRLQNASSGVYCAPLRLLAHQVFHDLNEKHGIPCSLVTGEEQRPPFTEAPNVDLEHPSHCASTVEMVDLGEPVDVAVLDEIQMIADPDRGWAWTQALLGLQAREIHLCGEESAIPIIKGLVESLGDDLQIEKYQRLNPLKTMPLVKNMIKELRKGDCIVAFTRNDIFKLRQWVERKCRKKCAVIYGGLPPETRVEQANLFNDQNSDYEILIASDAIGMGLNLSINRIIFSTVKKFNGDNVDYVTPRHIKQIAGRAGRFKHGQIQSPGEVTALKPSDLNYVKKCLRLENEDLNQACLSPSLDIILEYAKQLPETTFSKLLDYFENMAWLEGKYFLCKWENRKELANAIEHMPLELQDLYVLTQAPVKSAPMEIKSFVELAHGLGLHQYRKYFGSSKLSSLDDDKYDKIQSDGMMLNDLSVCQFLRGNDNNLDKNIPVGRLATHLQRYESLHRICVLYLWLHYRYPSSFPGVNEAFRLKKHLEVCISETLENQKLILKK